MMLTNHRMPKKMVIRSRFRSTTDEEPRVDDTPPPNMSDKPPPLPLCRSTSRTITRLVMIRMTETPMTIAARSFFPVELLLQRRASRLEADYLRELTCVEARPTNQGTIDVRLGHDRRNVVGFNRPPLQETQTFCCFVVVNRGNAVTNCRTGFLSVLGRGHLAGADGPDRLVRDHHAGHLLGRQARQAAADLAHAVVDLLAPLADLQRLADAHDRGDLVPERRL